MQEIKILYTFILVLHITTNVNAQIVSKEMAYEVAFNFQMNRKGSYISKNTQSHYRSADDNVVSIIKDNHECMYIVKIDGGWTLVSADERIQPILGYSLHNEPFPTDENMPPAMKDLLGSYIEQIRYVQDSVPYKKSDSKWGPYMEKNQSLKEAKSPIVTIVSNLLGFDSGDTIKWSQDVNANYDTTTHIDYTLHGKEYNKKCPTFYNVYHGHNIVGCVATAVGQVMRYWKWPHSAIVPEEMLDTIGTTSGAVLHEYNWDIMPCQLSNSSSDIEVDEVAGLLRDVGYAVKMSYKCKSSGANMDTTARVLRTIFGYSPNTKHHNKGINWVNKLKNELDNGRPILYCAYRKDTLNKYHGHTFVLSGYDSEDNFYVNWGYQGQFDAYFSLNDLYTYSNRHYLYNHSAIYGMQPDYPDCESYNLTNNDISGSNFEVYKGGPITIQNKTINSNQSGVIYSGSSIHITPPFHIARGANVHIAIRDMNCDLYRNDIPIIRYSPKMRQDDDNIQQPISVVSRFSLSPNPVSTILTINSHENLTSITIYSLSGNPILQTNKTEIDVSALPAGLYIVQATTSGGEQMKSKFIKL